MTLVAIVILTVGAVAVLYSVNCPEAGIAFSSERRNLHRLKNRTTIPTTTDFDDNATLPLLLTPGNDGNRWSQSRAARIEGYVQSVAAARPELANCYCGRDIHIHISLQEHAPPREHFVLEITPRLEPEFSGAKYHSVADLQQALVGRFVRFEGWLFYDLHHADESENIAPGQADNWRGTAWEIHPITRIEVIR